MHFLITGTAGFIGFHVARRLLNMGHSVVGFDGMTPYYDVRLKERRHAELLQFREFRAVIGMLEDKEALQRAAGIDDPHVIIHLAAQAGVRYSIDNPKAYIDSNLIGSWNILELARNVGPKHLLLASTSSVWGSNKTIPFMETDKTDEAMTLYAATKKSMEVMAHSYSHLFSIPITAVRFFTVYGPWGRPDMALFRFVKRILDNEPIEIYGGGKMSRDFTFIEDLVEGIVRLTSVIPGIGGVKIGDRAADTLSPVAPFRIVSIAAGRPTTLMDFIDVIEREIGVPVTRKMLPMQLGDVPQTFASPALLETLTGYKPSTQMDVGVRAFIDWYCKYYDIWPASMLGARIRDSHLVA